MLDVNDIKSTYQNNKTQEARDAQDGRQCERTELEVEINSLALAGAGSGYFTVYRENKKWLEHLGFGVEEIELNGADDDPLYAVCNISWDF